MTIVLDNGNVLECFPKTELSPEQFNWPNQEARDRDRDLFKANAHFIFKNRDKVFSDSKIFLAPVNIMSGAAYTGALVKPTLGTYVEWWVRRGSEDLAYFVSGSPLSGANVSKSIKPNGKTVELKADGLFLDLMKEFQSVHNRYVDARKECDAYTLEEAINALKAFEFIQSK